MAQTPVAVNNRFNAPTVVLGGQRERAFRTIALQLVQLAKDAEALLPDSTSAAQKTTIMNDLDTFITDLNTAINTISDTKRN